MVFNCSKVNDMLESTRFKWYFTDFTHDSQIPPNWDEYDDRRFQLKYSFRRAIFKFSSVLKNWYIFLNLLFAPIKLLLLSE